MVRCPWIGVSSGSRDRNGLGLIVAGVAGARLPGSMIAATAVARKESLERGSKQRLVSGIEKSHRCAMAMKHRGATMKYEDKKLN
jgi:hypothetical protein